MEKIKEKKRAISLIENCWLRHKNLQLFDLMKNALQSINRQSTANIIRILNPAEAKLIKDPALKAKIRFRLAGEEFPPFIVYKVFIATNGKGLKYLTGKKCITAHSDAAADACNIMGHETYLQLVLDDIGESKQNEINDEMDVSCYQEYIKFRSKTDESSAKHGGKANSWRRLSLEKVLWRENKEVVQNKQKHHYRCYSYPLSDQEEQIFTINRKLCPSVSAGSSRRSKQALSRVNKMKKMYLKSQSSNREGMQDQEINKSGNSNRNSTAKAKYCNFPEEGNMEDDRDEYICGSPFVISEIDFEDEIWDNEGQELYEWTKNLNT